jgi:hypothetical protein
MPFESHYEKVWRRPLWWLLAVLLFTVTVLAGCGSGETSSTKSVTFDATGGDPNRTSVDAFKQQVERTCKEGSVRLRLNVHPKGKTPADIAEVGLINQKIEREVISELEQVEPPPKFASAMRAILGYRRSLANELSTFAVMVRRQEKARFPGLAKSKSQLRVQLARVAEKAGFKECAKVG